jgi:hypothetical protein
MREYTVPFSTKEDEKFFFGLTGRQSLWFAAGTVLGAAAVFIPAAVFQVSFPQILLFIPLGLPFLGGGAYMALGKKRLYDDRVGVDTFYMLKIQYRIRTHDYVFRRGDR